MVLFNLNSGTFQIRFTQGKILLTENSGILNRSSGTTIISIRGGNFTVNQAGGFGNAGSGNLVIVLTGGTHTFLQGSGFGNGNIGNLTTHISGGNLIFSKNVLPPFNNFGTGTMTNNISGGNLSLFGSVAFMNKINGRVANNISGGNVAFSGPGTWGFVNDGTSTMVNKISGGMVSFTGGATGFVNSRTGKMTTSITGGTVFMDDAKAAFGTDLVFSGNSKFSTGVNGVQLGGVYLAKPYSANLTFSSPNTTYQAAIGQGSQPLQIISPLNAAGTSTVSLGNATLDVVSTESPATLVGSNYPIISTKSGPTLKPSIITGTYGKLSSSSLIKYAVNYNPTGVTITPMADQTFAGYVTGKKSNAITLAKYIDSLSNLANDNPFVVLNEFILDGNLSGYADALQQIQPSQLQALSGISFNNMTAVTRLGHTQIQAWTIESSREEIENIEPSRLISFKQLLTKQRTNLNIASLNTNSSGIPQRKGALAYLGMNTAPSQVNRHPLSGRIQVGKSNIWIEPYGQISKQNGKHNGNPDIKSQTGGLVMGADYLIAKNTILGLLGGTSTVPFSWNQDRGWGHMNSGFGGLYGGWKDCSGFYVEGQTIFGGSNFKTARHINYSTIDRTARESHSAFEFTGNLELGYPIPVYDMITFQPFIMADYMVMNESKYQEREAGSLNMNIRSRTSQYLQGEIGAILYKTFVIDDILLRPTAELGWVQRRPVGSNKNNIKGGFINQPSTLLVTGGDKVYNQIAPSLGLITQFADGLYIAGNVYAQCGNGLNIGEGLIRVGYEF